MSDKIAIDIVLIPPQEIIDLATNLNDQFSDKNQYISFREGYVPHISIGMRVISTSDLKLLENEIKNLASKTLLLDVSIEKLGAILLENKKLFDLSLNESKDLVEIYNSCEKILSKYNKYPALPAMFTEPEKVDELTTMWVDNYPSKSGIFKAHITLGAGQLPSVVNILHFKINTIAIFQLGPYCTCKKELARFNLE